MNTIFTVTKGANTPTPQPFGIDLGQDILEGVKESDRDLKASQMIRIDVQGPVRKLDDAVAMQDYLRKHGYPEAVVTEGVDREKSIEAKLKAAEKKYGKDKVAKVLEQILGEDADLA